MICPICKIEFKGRRNKIYCSPHCKRRAKKKRGAQKRWQSFIKNNPGFKDLKELDLEDFY